MTSKSQDDEMIANEDNTHHVAPEDELENGDRILVEVNEVEIAVFKTNDEYHAVANYCPHQGGPLCEGPISGVYNATKVDSDDGWKLRMDQEGEIIVCPWHGWEFDMISGDHKAHSGTTALTFNVIVKNGEVFISDPKLQ
jgi:nitrite reductase/ring-hydroxylating ferredoxin subunit